MRFTPGYFDSFFSLSNPLLFGLLLSAVITIVVTYMFVKVFYPLQKKRLLEKQNHKLEKAELMALFSELDPSPQIRIDHSGRIIQTNEAARFVFTSLNNTSTNIKDILPSLPQTDYKTELSFIDSVDGNIYSINVKPGTGYDFTNIYFYDITRQKEYERDLENYKNKLKDLADKLDASIEEVKKSVSLELHDDIGHSLMALKLKASGDNPDSAEILNGINNVYEKVRDLSKDLRPADIKKLGLVLSIQNIVEGISRGSGIKSFFQHTGDESLLDDEIGSCIIRVTQEALSNIVKHSSATEFTVGLTIAEQKSGLVIIDNGQGIPEKYFDPKNYKNFGIGLFNMKERVEKFNGTLRINSNSETGTVLIIDIPSTKARDENN